MMAQIDPPFDAVKIYPDAKPEFVFAPVKHFVSIAKQQLRILNRNSWLVEHGHYR
jgi:hypothetical protein